MTTTGIRLKVLLGIAAAGAIVMFGDGVVLRGAGGCFLQLNDAPVAFCETFDHPFPVTNRAGQLDGTLWGVSRIEGSITGNLYGATSPSTMDTGNLCGPSYTAQPGTTDVIVCNGQLRESSYDQHGVTALAIYPKQPFDFAGRIGTVGFDVSNDTTGSHGTWPEFWITDQPVPAPFSHGGNPADGTFNTCDVCSLPKNGLGIDFSSGNYGPNFGSCNNSFTVAEFKVVRNYIEQDYILYSSPNVTNQGCARMSTGPNGALNHIEIRVSQNQIDVYSTDAGGTALKHISTLSNANLSLTRGVIWLEDAHYNAEKAADKTFDPNNPTPDLSNHTFSWDNVAFDGPTPYRDVSLDVLDARQDTGLATSPDAHLAACPCNLLNLGWSSLPTSPVSLNTVSGYTQANIDMASASGRSPLLMFNFTDVDNVGISTINYTINGHPLSAPVPFNSRGGLGDPAGASGSHSVALPVPISAIVTGPQNIVLSASARMIIQNVNVVLIAGAMVPGTVPVPTNVRILP
jgi:hypothetical protein